MTWTVETTSTAVLLVPLALGCACLAEPPRRSDVWIAGAWSGSAMKEMATKLQPTGMTGFTGRAKWDLPAEAKRKKLAYLAHRKTLAEQLGIDKLHFSVHTYHRQANFPDSAARIGITGEHLRNAISPRRTEGKNWWIFCKSHDEFRDAMLDNIKAATDDGADVIHFEDFFREETQCVCDRCAEKFSQALQNDPRLAAFREPVRKMGIRDLARFRLRRYLLERTEGDERKRRRQFSQMGAFWRAWSAFKDHVAFDFLIALCDAGREHAKRTGREVAFVQHFWYFKPQDLATSNAYDGVWPETPLRHYGAQRSQWNTDTYRLGIAVYPPNGVMGSAASVLRGAFRRPPIFTGYGGDWYQKLASKRGPYARLLQIWTAEVYAGGGTMQYLYHLPEKQVLGREFQKKQRAQLNETFFDRARSPTDYRCPLDAVGRYTRFIRAHPDFYDDCEPPRYVLLLKTDRAYSLGNGEENVYAWAQLLDDAHVPYRVLLDGDDKERAPLGGQTLRGYHRVIALGSPDTHADAQIDALRQFAEGGVTAVVVGDKQPWERLLGQQLPLRSIEDLGTRYQLEHRHEALTEQVREELDARAIKTDAGPNVLIKLERSPAGPEWRLHLVNRNYRWLQDTADELRDVHVTLAPSLLMGDAHIRDVKASSPDGPEFDRVHVRVSDSGPTLTLPRLS
ncbi:MAG: hypothetical protein HON70_11920, partial [Lentisphaerae bacterium]|nr:hypothetical protein [Lentisphaerota bacterium]